MRVRPPIASLALALALATAALAAEPDPMARLDEALKGVAAFEYGKDAGPLAYVDQVVIEVAKDPKQRDAVEQRLIAALGSAATRDGKAFLCRELRTIGTARCVPALEALLADPQLSHMARYALGRIEDPAAAAALHRALAKTTGDLQVGIIGTLGNRRCEKALPDLVKLLGSPEPAVAEAAAHALGLLGGPDATKALEAARGKASGRLRRCVDDALLACADGFLAGGQKAEAARLYEVFYAPNEAKHLRIGALRGLVAARGEAAAALLVAAIKSPDPALQASAIGFAATMSGQGATKALADLLPSLAPGAQELLVRALAARGDASAAPAVVAATKSADEAVRVAALEALGSLGGAPTADLLVQAAAAGGGAEQQAARASLAQLRGDDVNRTLLQGVGSGEPKARIERIRALAGRGAREAVGDLLQAARDDDASVRREAVAALGTLTGEAQLAALIGLLVKPKEAGDRSAVEQAAANAFRRVNDGEKQAAPVLAALGGAPADAKPSLLRLLGRAATPKALDAVRAALKDPDAAVQDAAVRTLAEWPDTTPAEELLALARTAPGQTHKVLALRGYVRMAALSKDPTALYARAMELAERPDDKKLVLAGLGAAGSPEALKLIEPCLKDEPLQAEAGLAAVQIADRLREADAARAKAIVANVLALVKEPAVRQRAQEVLNVMTQFDDHIVAWLGSGPYKEKGKDARALFDIAFPPEQADAKDVKWAPITKGVGPWSISLDAAMDGGEDIAGYARTRVWSPDDQDVQLELGSDDAIKVWLNGKVVHANNTDRGIAARQDLVKAHLQKGWNDLLLKIVNHTGGWGFACRIRKPDGSALDGLKVEANP